MNPAIFGDSRLWGLVNDIIIEKWSLIDGDFRGGDISEKLLKRISKVLRERPESKYESKILEIGDKEGNLFGIKRLVYET